MDILFKVLVPGMADLPTNMQLITNPKKNFSVTYPLLPAFLYPLVKPYHFHPTLTTAFHTGRSQHHLEYLMDILFEMFDSGMANLPDQNAYIIFHTPFQSNIYPSSAWHQIEVFFYHEAFRVDFNLFYLGSSIS